MHRENDLSEDRLVRPEDVLQFVRRWRWLLVSLPALAAVVAGWSARASLPFESTASVPTVRAQPIWNLEEPADVERALNMMFTFSQGSFGQEVAKAMVAAWDGPYKTDPVLGPSAEIAKREVARALGLDPAASDLSQQLVDSLARFFYQRSITKPVARGEIVPLALSADTRNALIVRTALPAPGGAPAVILAFSAGFDEAVKKYNDHMQTLSSDAALYLAEQARTAAEKARLEFLDAEPEHHKDLVDLRMRFHKLDLELAAASGKDGPPPAKSALDVLQNVQVIDRLMSGDMRNSFLQTQRLSEMELDSLVRRVAWLASAKGLSPEKERFFRDAIADLSVAQARVTSKWALYEGRFAAFRESMLVAIRDQLLPNQRAPSALPIIQLGAPLDALATRVTEAKSRFWLGSAAITGFGALVVAFGIAVVLELFRLRARPR